MVRLPLALVFAYKELLMVRLVSLVGLAAEAFVPVGVWVMVTVPPQMSTVRLDALTASIVIVPPITMTAPFSPVL